MANYRKQEGVQGAWLKGADVKSGTMAKIVSETNPQPSSFTDKQGNPKTQDVAKIRLQGADEAVNISINRASINALVDAFGEDSKAWIGKMLTIVTEKVQVAGKRVTAVYLLPEGYELGEDDNGYVKVTNPNKPKETTSTINVDDIDPEELADIPF